MSYMKLILKSLSVGVFLVLVASVSLAQSALTDDAHTSTAPKAVDTNFGSNPNLTVSATGSTYIKFKVSSTLPAGTPGTDVAKATLKIYIGNVTNEGKIDVYQIASAWDESTITANNAPALGNLLVTTSQIGQDKRGKFLIIDLTSAVQAWLGDDGQGTNGSPNYGVALVVHPIDQTTPELASISIDSKENSQTSHEPALSVVLQNGAGGLSSVAHDETLTGDGTSGAPLGVADSGIGTVQLADGAVTSAKIGTGQVVKSLNTLKDDVVLAAGSNITVTPSANTLTIAASGVLTSVSHNQTLAGDGSNVTPLTVADLGVNTAQLANSSVTTGKLADNAVTTNKITAGAVTAPKLAVPLALSSADPAFTLSAANTGSGAAITATGAINTNLQYNIGGSRVLSVPVNNTIVGVTAGSNNTSGASNSFFGRGAGQFNTTGIGNSLFGHFAGRNGTTGGGNSLFGFQSGINTNGDNNSFFGSYTGQANDGGTGNSFYGAGSGVNNNSGNYNSFFGSSSGLNNTGGHNNSAVGWQAGGSNTTGFGNVFIGYSAGLSNTTEGGNTYLGATTNGTPGIFNATAIGYGAIVSQSNSVVLGQNSASVGIGTSAPQAKLHVEGGNILVKTPAAGIILRSPDGATCRLLRIDNVGALILTAVVCP